MEFLKFLKEETETPSRQVIIAAVLVGIFHGLLLATVMSAGVEVARSGTAPPRSLVLFVVCFALWASSRKFIMDWTSNLVGKVIRKVRVRISEQVARASVRGMEALGDGHVLNIVTQETQNISMAAGFAAGTLSSATLIILAMAYVWFVSHVAFFVIVVAAVLGVLLFKHISNSMAASLSQTSAMEVRFFEAMAHLLNGFKELKLDQRKAEDLLEGDLRTIGIQAEELRRETERILNTTVLFGQAFMYVLIGLMVFIIPNLSSLHVPIQKLMVIILFMSGPMNELASIIPMMTRANMSIQTLRQFEETLSSIDADTAAGWQPNSVEDFSSLQYEGIQFSYPKNAGGRAFQVGPLDLSLKSGEMVFLIGGNGTGKSTLLKLLCGLYPIQKGRILLNGKEISGNRIAVLRGNFSIILQDFHLFHRLLGHEKVDFERAEEVLRMFEIDHMTSVLEDGHFESSGLSVGQKKRLALMVSELDQRQVLIFDEWAADQDPQFRRFFYREYLPSLVERGKTVIAATHDDHYFDVADRVLKMSDGRIELLMSRQSEIHAGAAPGRTIGDE